MGQHGLQPALFLGQLTLQLLHYLHLDLGLGRALVRYSMRTERVTLCYYLCKVFIKEYNPRSGRLGCPNVCPPPPPPPGELLVSFNPKV